MFDLHVALSNGIPFGLIAVYFPLQQTHQIRLRNRIRFREVFSGTMQLLVNLEKSGLGSKLWSADLLLVATKKQPATS